MTERNVLGRTCNIFVIHKDEALVVLGREREESGREVSMVFIAARRVALDALFNQAACFDNIGLR